MLESDRQLLSSLLLILLIKDPMKSVCIRLQFTPMFNIIFAHIIKINQFEWNFGNIRDKQVVGAPETGFGNTRIVCKKIFFYYAL